METFTQAAMMLFQTVVGKKKGLSFNFLLMKIRISEDPLESMRTPWLQRCGIFVTWRKQQKPPK
jgi:hypothetical protein